MNRLDIHSLLAEPAELCWDRLCASNAAQDAGGARPDPAGPDDLDHALPWLVRHLGVAGALQSALDPRLDLDPSAAGASERAPTAEDQAAPWLAALRLIGYEARLVRCALDDLCRDTQPALLLLRNGGACVLGGSRQRRGERWLHLVLPGDTATAADVPYDEVNERYTGLALSLWGLAGSGGLASPRSVKVAASAPASDSAPGSTPAPARLQALARALQQALGHRPPPASGLQRWRQLINARLAPWWQALAQRAQLRQARRARAHDPAAAERGLAGQGFKFGGHRPISR